MSEKGKRAIILKLHNEGTSTKEIMKTALVTKWCVNRTIKLFRETGGFEDRVRSGRPRSVR